MPKPWSKVKAFQSDWTLRYGFEVSKRNPLTSELTSVLCLFCHQFGQENDCANECENGPPISNTLATHGEVTTLALTWSSNIQWNGRSMKAYHLKINEMGVMWSISDVEAAQHCRIVCAVNLQYRNEIFKNVWAFAKAIDAGNNARFQLQNYMVERQHCVFNWRSWRFCPDKYGWIKIKQQCLWYGNTWQHCVNNWNFSLQIVAGISKVCAERENRNSSADQLPPVLPLDLCSVHSRDFTSCSKWSGSS